MADIEAYSWRANIPIYRCVLRCSKIGNIRRVCLYCVLMCTAVYSRYWILTQINLNDKWGIAAPRAAPWRWIYWQAGRRYVWVTFDWNKDYYYSFMKRIIVGVYVVKWVPLLIVVRKTGKLSRKSAFCVCLWVSLNWDCRFVITPLLLVGQSIRLNIYI